MAFAAIRSVVPLFLNKRRCDDDGDVMRSNVTCFQGGISKERAISASVVQRSGIGPSSFIVCASYLHPVREDNKMAKYADDTYLLVGGSMRHNTLVEEIGNVSSWADENNLKLNHQKTKDRDASCPS